MTQEQKDREAFYAWWNQHGNGKRWKPTPQDAFSAGIAHERTRGLAAEALEDVKAAGHPALVDHSFYFFGASLHPGHFPNLIAWLREREK